MSDANEETIWTERASMRDFLVYPHHWALTIVTLGIYAIVVWLIRLSRRYTLTSERLVVSTGLLSKSLDEVELYRVQDTRSHQNLLERLVDIGRIEVITTDLTGNITIDKVPDPHGKREALRRQVNAARERRGVRTMITE